MEDSISTRPHTRECTYIRSALCFSSADYQVFVNLLKTSYGHLKMVHIVQNVLFVLKRKKDKKEKFSDKSLKEISLKIILIINIHT